MTEAELREQLERTRQLLRIAQRDLEEARAEIALLKAERRAAAA
jgi:hypothetical protein